MSRKRSFTESDLAAADVNRKIVNRAHKVPYTNTIRVYEQQGEFKMLKEKKNYTKNAKEVNTVFNNLVEKYKDTNCIIELLEVGNNKIKVLKSEGGL